MGHKYFIHRGGLKKLTEMAESGGGYYKAEIMVIKKDVELMVPRWGEEKNEWVQIKFMVYGG